MAKKRLFLIIFIGFYLALATVMLVGIHSRGDVLSELVICMCPYLVPILLIVLLADALELGLALTLIMGIVLLWIIPLASALLGSLLHKRWSVAAYALLLADLLLNVIVFKCRFGAILGNLLLIILIYCSCKNWDSLYDGMETK